MIIECIELWYTQRKEGGRHKMLPSFDDQFAAIKNNGTSFPNVTLFVQKDMGVMCKIGEMIRNGYQNKA